jgi:hypothetical protein
MLTPIKCVQITPVHSVDGYAVDLFANRKIPHECCTNNGAISPSHNGFREKLRRHLSATVGKRRIKLAK